MAQRDLGGDPGAQHLEGSGKDTSQSLLAGEGGCPPTRHWMKRRQAAGSAQRVIRLKQEEFLGDLGEGKGYLDDLGDGGAAGQVMRWVRREF